MPDAMYGRAGPAAGAGGVLVARTRHSGRLRTPSHRHAAICIHHVLRGTYCESTPARRYRLGPGWILFKPPEEVHSNTFAEDGSTTLRIEIQWEAVPDLARHLPSRPRATRSPVLAGIAARLGGELSVRDGLSGTLLRALSTELLVELAREGRAPARSRDLTRRCRDFLEASFHLGVGLEEAARALGVHRSHLARVFRQDTGCTVGRYLERVRLDWVARTLQRDRGRSLAVLAHRAGFADQSHLTRAFKRRYGAPPGRWARFLRAPDDSGST